MRIKIPLRQWLFTTWVLSIMLTALVNYYPGAWAEVTDLSEQAKGYFQELSGCPKVQSC